MTDYTELQKAAEYAAQDTIKFADESEEMRALQQFHEEVDPETVLALIAENERLERKNANQSESIREYQDLVMGGDVSLGMLKADIRVTTGERDQLRAEVSGLKTGYEAYERVNAELKAENEALRNALAECTSSLQGEMLQKFGGQLPEDMHPVTRREYDRDVAELYGYRAALGKGDQS